jgi:hypothetical protein
VAGCAAQHYYKHFHGTVQQYLGMWGSPHVFLYKDWLSVSTKTTTTTEVNHGMFTTHVHVGFLTFHSGV